MVSLPSTSQYCFRVSRSKFRNFLWGGPEPATLERTGRGWGEAEKVSLLQKNVFSAFSYKIFSKLPAKGGWEQALVASPLSLVSI